MSVSYSPDQNAMSEEPENAPLTGFADADSYSVGDLVEFEGVVHRMGEDNIFRRFGPSLTFGIDYDHTWSADPPLFEKLVKLLLEHGHQAFIVTGRQCKDKINNVGPISIFYTGREPKKAAMESFGIPIDIWIDDDPKTIESEFDKYDDPEL